MNKLTIIFTAVMITLFVVFFDGEKEDAKAGDGKVVYTGVDLSCDDCEQQLEDALNNIIGIEDYEVNEEDKTITVWFDAERMKADWIEKSLEASGFTEVEAE